MRNVKIDEVDRLDRDVVALGNDYAQGFILPPHQHRRAQLLYGATGLMYVTTQTENGWFLRNTLSGSPLKPCMPSDLQG